MKYIDKNKNVVRGTAIIDQLLSDNWLDDTYTNIDYDNGLNNKRKPYRKYNQKRSYGYKIDSF